MSKEAFDPEYVAMAASDHEVLSAFGERVKKMLSAESPEYVQTQIASIKLLFDQKLVPHFAFEEEHIFPALLAGNLGENTSRLVAALQEEHKSLLEDVRRLNEMFSDQKLVSARGSELRKAILDFFESLHAHATQEDELFRTLTDTAT